MAAMEKKMAKAFGLEGDGRHSNPWSGYTRIPAPAALVAINALGLPFIVWGLISLDVWITLFGLAVHMAGKN